MNKNKISILGCVSFLMTVGSLNAANIAVANGDFSDRTGSQYISSANWTVVGNTGGYVNTESNTAIMSTDASGAVTSNYLFMDVFGVATSDDITSVTPSSVYTALVEIGKPKATYNRQPVNPFIEILLDGVVVGSSNVQASTLANDTWNTLSVSFTSTATDVGQIAIRLRDGGNGQQSFYDNVTLDVSPIPEPTSAALLGLGGLALILRRRN